MNQAKLKQNDYNKNVSSLQQKEYNLNLNSRIHNINFNTISAKSPLGYALLNYVQNPFTEKQQDHKIQKQIHRLEQLSNNQFQSQIKKSFYPSFDKKSLKSMPKFQVVMQKKELIKQMQSDCYEKRPLSQSLSQQVFYTPNRLQSIKKNKENPQPDTQTQMLEGGIVSKSILGQSNGMIQIIDDDFSQQKVPNDRYDKKTTSSKDIRGIQTQIRPYQLKKQNNKIDTSNFVRIIQPSFENKFKKLQYCVSDDEKQLKDVSDSDEDFDIKFYNQMESINKEIKNKLLQSPTDQFIQKILLANRFRQNQTFFNINKLIAQNNPYESSIINEKSKLLQQLN